MLQFQNKISPSKYGSEITTCCAIEVLTINPQWHAHAEKQEK